MEFSPNNPVIRLCIQGMSAEEKGNSNEAAVIFQQAWEQAAHDLEKYLAAYFLARHQPKVYEELKWLETSLQHALKVDDPGTRSALPLLYSKIAHCYEAMQNPEQAKKYRAASLAFIEQPEDDGPFFHGTKADLNVGDLLNPGGQSNYQPTLTMNHIYFTALHNGAGLAAALAPGDSPEHVYVVEPTGRFEHDPNVTNKKFPGNPTRSYRSASPLKITGEIKDWSGQTPESIREWREKLANNKGKIIN